MIPIARPWMGEAEAVAARRAILSGWVTQGPEVEAFEGEFAAFVGADRAVAVSSGTAALHVALLAVGVGPGDEVITVSHSFIATANAIRYCGATPIFVDVEAGTYNIDATRVERAIGPRTRAILCVHQMGMPCDLPAIAAVADRHRLALVEDAACAIGSEIEWGGAWERIGRPRGRAACFSLHPRKLVSTGDGGMITTADPELDAALRRLRQHGMTVNDRARHHADRIVTEEYAVVGFNYRLTDIQAAVGREQLARLPDAIVRRRALATRYRELLMGIPGIGSPVEPRWARSNFQSYCVRLPDGCEQRAVMERMLADGVATRRGVMCAHREPAYRTVPWSCVPGASACGCGSASCLRLIESERAQDRCILIPLFHDLRDEDQHRIVESLRRACAAASVPHS